MTKETRLDGGRPVLTDEMQPPGVALPRDRSPALAQADGVDFRPVGRVAAELALRLGWARLHAGEGSARKDEPDI